MDPCVRTLFGHLKSRNQRVSLAQSRAALWYVTWETGRNSTRSRAIRIHSTQNPAGELAKLREIPSGKLT
jgi:hypothetical protein